MNHDARAIWHHAHRHLDGDPQRRLAAWREALITNAQSMDVGVDF